MNKPENVKLEVYKFNLNPGRNYAGNITFRDLFLKVLSVPNNTSNENLFIAFFRALVTTLDTEYKQIKNKAFTLINTNNETSFNSNNQTIFGILDGGPLGEGKTRRKLSDKNDENALDGNVINDKYFFYIHIPLNSDRGYIMFQVYQQDSIRHEFFNYIFKGLFKHDPDYNMPNFDPYLPQSIKDEFKHGAKVKELKFTEKLLSREIDESASFVSINEEYKIEVKITPVRSTFGTQFLNSLLTPFLSKEFNNKKLEDFDGKKITLKNRQTKRDATFELDGTGDIMPRIYLHNRISISPYGVPNFDELKVFCDNLLSEIVNTEPRVQEIE
ncbi:hypothetical protein ACLI09_08210 [Flavobacterium sp. RHBU_24]|uniref:hypothetical protein n=1 Tax=Flavobacterium sp. RHBU_24 TaxID=3391185 RepID=UPI00398565AF